MFYYLIYFYYLQIQIQKSLYFNISQSDSNRIQVNIKRNNKEFSLLFSNLVNWSEILLAVHYHKNSEVRRCPRSSIWSGMISSPSCLSHSQCWDERKISMTWPWSVMIRLRYQLTSSSSSTFKTENLYIPRRSPIQVLTWLNVA